MTSWTRGPLAALAVCVLLCAGAAGCGSSGARGSAEGKTPTPVGKVIDHTDEEGRPYREVTEKGAPEVGVEVRPDAGGSWDVRLTVRRFRFSPAGTAARPAPGRGLAHLLVDGRLVGRLRAPDYRLSARLVPRGTHHITARLYADDDTVWAVAGKPVQSTADITASDPAPDPGRPATPTPAPTSGAAVGSGPTPAPTPSPGRTSGPGSSTAPTAAPEPGAASDPAPAAPGGWPSAAGSTA
ncbi:nuclear transport factor 2 family protein [Streptomyces sp. NPDC015220]|uniref:nuclear transport factor 2 family protein n=1 Tax=Streptomyces sp. NPDC015220 TaxID=3364947 RepID=UPI0036FDC62C